jgi:hypothetical protein
VGGGVIGGIVGVGGNGNLSGIIRDPTGAIVPGAHVTVSNDSGFSQTVNADSSGRYNFNDVPPGAAKVAFRADSQKVYPVPPLRTRRAHFVETQLAASLVCALRAASGTATVNPL